MTHIADELFGVLCGQQKSGKTGFSCQRAMVEAFFFLSAFDIFFGRVILWGERYSSCSY